MSPFTYPVGSVRLKLRAPGGEKLRVLELGGTLDPEHVIAIVTNVIREEYAKKAISYAPTKF